MAAAATSTAIPTPVRMPVIVAPQPPNVNS